MRREPMLALIAESFGRCMATCPPRAEADRVERLRRIARILDRLTRAPARRSWPARARKIYDALIANTPPSRATSVSLWATS